MAVVAIPSDFCKAPAMNHWSYRYCIHISSDFSPLAFYCYRTLASFT